MIGTHAAMVGFDTLQSAQQFQGRQSRIHRHDRIMEFRSAIGHAPRIGSIQR